MALFISLIVLLSGNAFAGWPLSWTLIPVVIYIALIAIGSYKIQLNFFLKAFHSGSSQSNAIALTFDDGPSPYTFGVLDVLKSHNAKATFFCIGKEIENHPEILERIHAEGHTIGNHSYAHTNTFPILKVKKMKMELEKTGQLIENLTGQKSQLFRPPFGVTNPRIAKAVKSLKLDTIGWSVRSYDTVSKNEVRVAKRILQKLKPGAVILLHDNLPNAASVLDKVLIGASAQNLVCMDIPTFIKTSANQ